MTSHEAIARVHIAGNWSADDFSLFMRACNDVYCISLILSADLLRQKPGLRDVLFPLDRRNVRKVASTFAPKPWLDVRRISYASLGSIDLLGIGAILGHVKDFSVNVLDRFQTREFRKLELKEKQRLATKANYEDEQQRNDQLALARHAEQERTLSIAQKRLEVEELALKNQALRLTNLDSASIFAQKIISAARRNELSTDEVMRLAKWLDSRAGSIRELVELKQILDVEILRD